jgi:hypothetical protein
VSDPCIRCRGYQRDFTGQGNAEAFEHYQPQHTRVRVGVQQLRQVMSEIRHRQCEDNKNALDCRVEGVLFTTSR